MAVGEAATGILESPFTDASTRVMSDRVFVKENGQRTVRRSSNKEAALNNKPTWGFRRMATVLGAAAILAAGAVAAVLVAVGGDDTPTTVLRESTVTTKEAIPEPDERIPSSNRTQQSNRAAEEEEEVPEGFTEFMGAAYSSWVPDTWEHDETDQRSETGFYTNIWREPGDPENTYIRIDGGNRATAATPTEESEGLVQDLREDPEYREIYYGPDSFGGVEAARWVYEIEGDKRVDYFFVECGRGLAVLGSTERSRFTELKLLYRGVAASTVLNCSG